MTKTPLMVLSSWFFKYFFKNSVLNRWVLWAGHWASDCALGKPMNWKLSCQSLSLLADSVYRAIHQAAKGWSDLVTAGWGKFNWKRPVYRCCQDQSSPLPWGANRWEKAMKWQTAEGTKDWLGSTSSVPSGRRQEISWSNLLLPRWAHAGPFPWCLRHFSDCKIIQIILAKLELKVILWGPPSSLKI